MYLKYFTETVLPNSDRVYTITITLNCIHTVFRNLPLFGIAPITFHYKRCVGIPCLNKKKLYIRICWGMFLSPRRASVVHHIPSKGICWGLMPSNWVMVYDGVAHSSSLYTYNILVHIEECILLDHSPIKSYLLEYVYFIYSL